MTKAKFFDMLTAYIANHNSQAADAGYTAAQLKPFVFHEDPAKLAEYKAKDPAYPWTAHAAGFILADCWHIEVTQHKTAEAAEKQNKIFSRWIAEYKAAN